ncbi:hypothetical protein, partial [Pseudomonas sp. K5002]
RCSGVAAPLPLFSSMLNYRHRGGATRSQDAQHAWEGMQTLTNDGRTNYPLTLNVDDLGDGYDFTALTPAQVGAQRVCGYMQMALTQLVEALEHAPHQALDRLPILGDAERQQLLFDFNATEVDYDLAQTLHGLFEAQVERTPDALAVKAGEQCLTYAELNQRANQL